jgi:hypothetical protein
MSAVRSRLRMLERRAHQRPCPLCGDRGSDRVVVHFEGEPPPATGCPRGGPSRGMSIGSRQRPKALPAAVDAAASACAFRYAFVTKA